MHDHLGYLRGENSAQGWEESAGVSLILSHEGDETVSRVRSVHSFAVQNKDRGWATIKCSIAIEQKEVPLSISTLQHMPTATNTCCPTLWKQISTIPARLTNKPWNGAQWKVGLKGIVHPKMKIWCLSAYPQGIQDVGDFVSSVEHKRRFLTQTIAVCQSYNVSQWYSQLWEKKTYTDKTKLNPVARDNNIEV